MTIARSGTPVVALITERFWEQSRHVAQAGGMPDLLRAPIPYPVAGTGDANLARVASAIADDVLHALGVERAR